MKLVRCVISIKRGCIDRVLQDYESKISFGTEPVEALTTPKSAIRLRRSRKNRDSGLCAETCNGSDGGIGLSKVVSAISPASRCNVT